jgi:polyisoprenoid-binding protein YceI
MKSKAALSKDRGMRMGSMTNRIRVLGLAVVAAVVAVTGLCPGPEVLAQAAGQTETFEVDGGHSTVLFAVGHLEIGRVWGRFTKVKGTVTVEAGKYDQGTIAVEVDAASVYTGSRKRDDHLRGPDFFKTKQFKSIAFAGRSGKSLGDGRFEVTGELTLLGVTKTVTATAKHLGAGRDPWGGFRAGYEVRLTIRRSDFGMKYGLPGVGDVIELIIAIEAVRKS